MARKNWSEIARLLSVWRLLQWQFWGLGIGTHQGYTISLPLWPARPYWMAARSKLAHRVETTALVADREIRGLRSQLMLSFYTPFRQGAAHRDTTGVGIQQTRFRLCGSKSSSFAAIGLTCMGSGEA